MNQAQAFFHLETDKTLFQHYWETPQTAPKPRRFRIVKPTFKWFRKPKLALNPR